MTDGGFDERMALYLKREEEKMTTQVSSTMLNKPKSLERTRIRLGENGWAQLPMLPNFIKAGLRGGLGEMLPLSALTKAELRAIAEAWTEELVARGMDL